MSNPLFQQATQGGPSKIQAIRQMMGTLRGQDPNKIIPLLMQKNPSSFLTERAEKKCRFFSLR